jgi:hypothetical protein
VFLLGVLLRDSSLGISMAPLGRRLVLLVFAVVMTTPVFGKVIIHFYSPPCLIVSCLMETQKTPKNSIEENVLIRNSLRCTKDKIVWEEGVDLIVIIIV